MTTDALPSVVPVSEADQQRRALLLHTVQAVGGIGVLAAAVPFVASFEPSERARAEGGPVEASWAALQAGELQTVAWRLQAHECSNRRCAVTAAAPRRVQSLPFSVLGAT